MRVATPVSVELPPSSVPVAAINVTFRNVDEFSAQCARCSRSLLCCHTLFYAMPRPEQILPLFSILFEPIFSATKDLCECFHEERAPERLKKTFSHQAHIAVFNGGAQFIQTLLPHSTSTEYVVYLEKKRNFSIVTTDFFFGSHSTHGLSENFIDSEQNGYILEHSAKYVPGACDSHIKRTTMPLMCVWAKVEGGARDKRDTWLFSPNMGASIDTFEYVHVVRLGDDRTVHVVDAATCETNATWAKEKRRKG